MTPELFCERYFGHPSLLSVFIRSRYDDGDDVGLDIACKIIDREPVTLEELQSVPVNWQEGILQVALFSEYVTSLRSPKPYVIPDPFVDKKHGLIIELGEGSHENLAMNLFAAYEGYNAAIFEHRGPRYIIKGYGYYLSSVCKVFYVGKILFDQEALTEDDALVLGGRIGVIETINDFNQIKWRG